MSLELTLSIIALVASIVSPVITVFIKKRYELKMKKLDIFETHKIEALEKYSEAVQSCLNSLGITTDYLKYGSIIFLYAPKSSYDTIHEIDKLVRSSDPWNVETMRKTRELLSDVLSSCHVPDIK